MKKIILTFGLISGAISGGMFLISLPFHDRLGYDNSLILGYTTIVLSFLLVFFGIRSYRDNVCGGVITFGKAFQTGILITLVSCMVYVAVWEVIFYGTSTGATYMDNYNAHVVEEMKKAGATPEAIETTIAEGKSFAELYKNPFVNIAFTLMEPFPVGLILTLLSAAILRKKPTTTNV